MRCSGIQIFAFLVLLLATAAVIIGFGTSYWSEPTALGGDTFEIGSFKIATPKLKAYHRGLWRECFEMKLGTDTVESTIKDAANEFLNCAKDEGQCPCNIIFDSDGYTSSFGKLVGERKWQYWEMAVVVLVGLSGVIGLLSLFVSPCCCANCGVCLTNLVLSAALCGTSGIATYAYYHFQVNNYDVDSIGWSFWITVGGVLGQYFAVLFFAIAACQIKREYSAI